jgi:cation diffusion facilitator CzcD-associated flavoprotein CzcO
MTQITETGHEAPESPELDYEAIVVGAGICGIYQMYKLKQLGVKALVLEAESNLGGTWYRNRYPGARFDSESFTYAYFFSKELWQEWDWSERFAAQPETLRYLEHVADKFDLRRHMQFDSRVESMIFDEPTSTWTLRLNGDRTLRCRFVVLAVGLLSAATLPRLEGIEDFQGRSFHTSNWPADLVDLSDKRVAVLGTGSTGIQLVAEIADKAKEVTVLHRRPNWAAPLNNSALSREEMDDIKARHGELYEFLSRTPGGFFHAYDERPLSEVSREERLAFWEQKYAGPGFAIWHGNFRECFTNDEANAELSAFIADKIRSRVKDPVVAEKLIPKDHGFGVQRVPMEINYFEAYNRDNVHLVDLLETPIVRVTPTGVQTTEAHLEFDVIAYATGWDAITGAFEAIDIRGVNGLSLREAWADGPVTQHGLQVAGFPNILMPVAPQNGSASANFPRGIEFGVEWVTDLLRYMREHGYTRVEADPKEQASWVKRVKELYDKALIRKAQSWLTGYNSNLDGHEKGKIRHVIWAGSFPEFRAELLDIAAKGYPGFNFGSVDHDRAISSAGSLLNA